MRNTITRTVLGFILGVSLCIGQAIVTTVAGTGVTGFSGDGGPAVNAKLGAGPGTGATLTVGIDKDGQLLIVDGGNKRVRKVNAAGTINTVAGGGSVPSGDGGPATSAQLFPGNVAVDGAGNMYISQGASIRKVNTSGIINTIAGNGLPGDTGDGGNATAAQIYCQDLTVDAAGNVYFTDPLHSVIRKIDTAGIITTIAGTGQSGYSGDGGPAAAAKLQLSQGITIDSVGNLYFADNAAYVRKISTDGTISTIAGNGSGIPTGDGGPAKAAGMAPRWIAVDSGGNVFVADAGTNRIRKINTSGIITTYAGGNLNTGTGNGDGGPASGAVFTGITSIAVDPAGNLYVSDAGADRIREISSGSSASPVSVSPPNLSFSYTTGDPAPPTQSVVIISPGSTLTFTAAASTTSGGNWLDVTPKSGDVHTTLTISVNPSGLAPGPYTGTITITPSGAGNPAQTVPVKLTVSAPQSQGIITTVAGNGFVPFTTEGGQATSSGLSAGAVALDGAGNVYIADTTDNRVLKVNTAGVITILAGNGTFSYSGDGGPAKQAALFTPLGVAADAAGNVYIADSLNNRVRKVDTSGTITTVAGNGSVGFAGDGGPAKNASVWAPSAVAVDGNGNLYIADATNNRIRKVNSAGVISTVAGGAALPTFSGDGGQAVGAGMLLPGGVAVDASGNLYIADIGDNRIRKVSTSGIITTVAGNGTKGFSGDGAAATSAQLNLSSAHIGLWVDSAGNLYIPDPGNNRVRKVDATGIITTVAGNGIGGFSGDGSPAVSAGLNAPIDVFGDSAGNIYIADGKNNRVRKVTFSSGAAAPLISSNGVQNGASFQPGAVANSWVTIKGSNLASVTDTWDNFIVNGNLPATLHDVSVTIGDQPAYMYYVSPTQLNVLAPNLQPGPAQVVVKTPSGTSSSFTVTVSQYGPAFFAWPGNQAVATRQDFSLAAKAGTFAGATTVPAKPGDVIILWGTGFGPTSPAAPTGVQVPSDRTYSTTTLPTVTINNVQATVYGAALAPGYAGLYQVAIQVPTTLPDGDWPLIATIGGVSSPSGVVLTVAH